MINHMKRKTNGWVVLLGTMVGAVSWAVSVPYPAAPVKPVTETRFGTILSDPYRWLETKDSPDVQAWVRAEDALAKAYLDKIPGREALAKRLKELYDVDAISLPDKEGPRLFYTHRQIHQEKAAVYWQAGDGHEHRLIDPNAISPQTNLSLGEMHPSPQGTKFAYTLKPHNADEATLHVRDVDTGQEDSHDTIPGADIADLTWTPDNRGFYYTRLPTDPSLPREDRVAYATVRYHALRTPASNDSEVYPPTHDASVYLSPLLSRDCRWLFIIAAHGWTSNNLFYRDRHSAPPVFQPLFISTCAMASAIAWKDKF